MDDSTILEPHFQELGTNGINWVLECLKAGEVFSRLVLSEVDINNGKMAILIGSEKLRDAVDTQLPFTQSVGESQVSYLDVQLQIILNALRSLEHSMGRLAVISEEDISYPSDTVRRLPTLPFFRLGDRYIYIQRLSELQKVDDFAFLMSRAVGHSSNAFIVPQKMVPTQNNISDPEAARLAESTIAIVNTAFHSEAYTLWTRTQTS